MYIKIKFSKEKERVKFQLYLKKYEELFPPWIVFPDIFQGSPKWNQGIKEDYGIHHWLPY